MSVIERDTYAKLLLGALPTVIQTEKQNDRYIELLEKLDRQPRLSREERAFAELITVLVEKFEDEHYRLKPASPLGMLEYLMDANNLRQKDLVDVFGSESVVSEVLRGKREFSKEHIRRLSQRFNVSPALFFDVNTQNRSPADQRSFRTPAFIRARPNASKKKSRTGEKNDSGIE
ncbi:MAG: helix-turn-helix domain-containing protein [Bryobacteraceae bacterium]